MQAANSCTTKGSHAFEGDALYEMSARPNNGIGIVRGLLALGRFHGYEQSAIPLRPLRLLGHNLEKLLGRCSSRSRLLCLCL
jgi:hypothetical protein